MATETLVKPQPVGSSTTDTDTDADFVLSEQVRAVLKPLASLKLTVVLFALAIVVIFVGSLAQGRKDVWLVVGQYFRTPIAWIDVADLFPPAFFPGLIDTKWDDLWFRYIPFPGGWGIGFVMALNLLAAHLIRFRINAKGSQLIAGLATLVVGVVATCLVVSTGMTADGFQTEPLLDYGTIWILLLGGMGATSIALLVFAWRMDPDRQVERQVYIGLAVANAALVIWLLTQEGMGQMTDASMRILWQLMKAEFASLILLAGCVMLFAKRCGIVLLHSGVGVLMLSELLVGLTATENRLQLNEGQTASFVSDLRERELVVIDYSGEQARVVSIPESRIVSAAGTTDLIQHEDLPFDIEVVEFARHSKVTRKEPGQDSPANMGTGSEYTLEELPAASGMQSRTDVSSAYIRVREKQSSSSLGTWLVAMASGDQPETVAYKGQLYDLMLRFKRTYKPYSVTLLDVRKDDYIGTSMPQNFSSDVRLVDPERGVDRKLRIWMNNPLRYAGETFYQTDYYMDEETGEEMTSLQVVDNRGWMLPYMACMIVGTGLAAQFLLTLSRFRRRRNREDALAAPAPADERPLWKRPGIVAPVVAVVIAFGYLGSKVAPPRPDKDEFDVYGFGSIPVVKGGRKQPLDSVARNRMRVLTNGKTEFDIELSAQQLKEDWDDIADDIADRFPDLPRSDLDDFEGDVPRLVAFLTARTPFDQHVVRGRIDTLVTEKAPAVRWLLDTISRRPEAQRHRVFRIDEPQLISVLDLQPREGARYSLQEIMQHLPELDDQVQAARKLMVEDADRATGFQRRLLKLAGNVNRTTVLADVFGSFGIEFDATQPQRSVTRTVMLKGMLAQTGAMEDSSLVLSVPCPSDRPEGVWEALALASFKKGLLAYAQEHGCRDRAALTDELCRQLPEEVVFGRIDGASTALMKPENRSPGVTRSARAAEIAAGLPPEEQSLRGALLAIAEADDSATARQIYDGLPEARRSRLYAASRADVITDLLEVVPPAVRARTTETIRSSGPPTDALLDGMIRELTGVAVTAVVNDAELEAGPNPATQRQLEMVTAWKQQDRQTFNRLVDEHHTKLGAVSPAVVNKTKTDFEAWFNHFAPSYYCAFLYLFGFVLSCAALLGAARALNRTAFALIGFTFLVHTLALIARIYISGRPPVTNLYSSAVFIGWGCVLFGLISEYVSKNGLGNLVSAGAGSTTLGIAYMLGFSGDTFEVLRAVLDTQFWLSTHVVCITLGYATTFLAGLFGIVYVIKGVFTPTLTQHDRRELTRMIYGTLCFALLFSFIGTVLGGLWADDSWGRFWGWDPKENGALIIVLWNAIVLHARWDGMVKDRGMAVLAVAGNICTAWSWFGVNELRAGLHAYGFTEGRLFALLLFILSQMIILAIGTLPREYWLSFRKQKSKSAA